MSPRHRGPGRRYRIDYAEQTREHLKKLAARDRASVVDAIDDSLGFEPAKETRNRKRMEDNSLEAGFELRVGPLRVYHDVDQGGRAVSVLAIGVKDRDRVLIGGEEIKL